MPSSNPETPRTEEPTHTHSHRKSSPAYEAWLLGALILIVYAARLGNVPIIKADDFWGANASASIAQTGRFALPGFDGLLKSGEKTFFHPPAFCLLQALWIRVLGVSTVSIRIVPTISALLSLVFLYGVLLYLTRERKHSRRLSMLGVSLVAFNPLTFVLARHSRPEATIMLLAAATVYVLRRSLFDPEPTRSERAVTPFVAGLLSGLAFACHYWSWFLPGTVGLVLLCRRRWRTLAWYALGYGIFVALVGAWMLTNWVDFLAETRWFHGDTVSANAVEYLRLRLKSAANVWFNLKTVGTWIVLALAAGLVLLGGLRKKAADRTAPRSWVLIGIALFGFLLLFPRQSSYYLICALYYWGAIVPLAFSRLLDGHGSASSQAWKRRGALAASLAVLSVELGGLGFIFHRDRHADYVATFRPFAEALEAADPTRTQTIVAPSLSYMGLSDRPFLADGNPSLWKGDATPNLEADAEHALKAWRARGVRFVLMGTLDGPERYPSPTSERPLRRAVAARIEAGGRQLMSRKTNFYVALRAAYRPGRLTLYDIGTGG